MTSRRIAITTPRPPPQTAANRANPAWQSSLDLVFSFSRSQAFFGSNLPSSPSFVARYRRPGFPDDEESSITAASDRDAEGRTTSEDRDEHDGSIATSDEEWSEDELDERAIQSWDQDAPPVREQLPRNAVASKKGRRSARQGRSSDASPSPSERGSLSVPSSYTSVTQVANERSPLLARDTTKAQTPHFSPPDSVPFPRRTSLVSAALLSHAKANRPTAPLTFAQRRLSIISSEAWEEAVDEKRGRSTYGQTLFNTVNVLVGIGLLATPLAFADAGWALGTFLLLFCAVVTNYTAKMLAKAMAQDHSLRTYADVLIKAFGPRARTFVHFMFVLELGALSIALVVLFSDSMATLYPSWSSTSFKLLGYFIILPTTFLPLRFLSITSLLGILSSFTLLVVLITDGAMKRQSPGSLWEPMATSWGPRWYRLPLSFGLFMSGFSGHAVIPSLYRDMKNPEHFNSVINVAYIIACSTSLVMGVIGYVMFGKDVTDEVTQDMLFIKGYPAGLNSVVMWMVAVSPVCKYAIGNRPLIATLEHVLGVHGVAPPEIEEVSSSAIASDDSHSSMSLGIPILDDRTVTLPPPHVSRLLTIIHIAIRPTVTALVVALAILIPDFGRVLSFLGSASAFLICCIGPIGAYLILGSRSRETASRKMGRQIKVEGAERVLCWFLLVVSVVFAVTGTVWSFLPVD